MTFSLAHLSVDVLGLILNNKQCSYLVIDLWKTGDPILRAKLASAITYLYLKDNLLDSTSRYPKLVSSLRNLHYFSINRGNFPLMTTSRDLSSELQKLSSLQTLKIQSSEAGTCLLNHAPTWSISNQKYVETPYGSILSNLIDMARLFPYLSKLKLGSSNEAISSFSGLPPTLTSLTLRNIDSPASILASLPRNLTELKGEMYDTTRTSDWLLAPPNLTRIPQINALGFDKLPPMLQDINLSIKYWSTKDIELHDDLKSLSIEFTDSEAEDLPWTSELPKNLETFRVTTGDFTATSVASLPKSITSLLGCFSYKPTSTAENSSESDKEHFSWPHHLRMLWIQQAIDESFLASLSMLSFLRVLEFDYKDSKLNGSILPRTLVNLTINVRHVLSILPGMPLKLDSLSIDSSSRGVIDEGSFQNLPPSLRDLSLSDPSPSRSFTFPYLSPIQLPPRLTALLICSWNMDWELPRSLTSLELLHLYNFKERLDLPPYDPFSGFPSSLIHFSIGEMDQSEILSKLAFSSLTRLNHLSCPSKVHSSVLRGLSRRLASVLLRMGVFDAEDAPFLPPRLTLCSVGLSSGPLPSNIGAYWPLSARLWTKDLTSLEVFRLRQSEATTRCTAYPDPRVVERTTKALS